jgi:hypothetical protein
VSQGQTRTAREVFSIKESKLKTKEEMDHAEKRKERLKRKRSIHNHMVAKKNVDREKRRKLDTPLMEKFEYRVGQKLKEANKAKKGGDQDTNKREKKNGHKSANFFEKMQSIAKADIDKKKSGEKGGKGAEKDGKTNKSGKHFKL